MTPAGPVDLRSDTVTRPSAGMRRAMAEAEVGDDVLDGDPTTRALEERVAALLGAEAALFFPSGVQANQTAMWLLGTPGTEVVLDARAHLVQYEKGGLAALAGLQIHPIETDGLLAGADVRRACREVSDYTPRISVVAAENTHNAAGGRVTPPAAWDDLVAAAEADQLPVHLDGARLWHAAVALGIPIARLARGAATTMVSFSKGLGCPVGSCLAGPQALMAEAREVRRRLGGGMRQSGILAAAALYALDHHVDRLAEDHAHAALLAECVAGHPRVRVRTPETNIVVFDLVRDEDEGPAVVADLEAAGVRMIALGSRRLRAVTHRDVSRDAVLRAGETLARVLA